MSNKITISRRRLLRVYEKQARYLIDKGYDRMAGDNQEVFLKELEKVGKELKIFDYLNFQEHNIPLLLVISRQVLEINLQMKNLKIGSNPGVSKITDYGRFEDKKNQRLIYPIFNIDCGNDQNPYRAYSIVSTLTANGRSGLHIEEGIALARYYGHILMRKGFYLVGSARGNSSHVPTLVYLHRLSHAYLTLSKGFKDPACQVPSRDCMFDS